MRCPVLSELPLPSEGKTGWPWTEESSPLPELTPQGFSWPRIGIVTPSFNQAEFIEETIRSVLLQGYPNQEYIIIDGGSKDSSVDVIKKYEKWVAYWVSEPDRGQSHAINKGFHKTTGEIVAWINSDDLYTRDSFMNVGRYFTNNPDMDMVFGDCALIDDRGNQTGRLEAPYEFSLKQLIETGDFIPQPSVFFTKKALKESGGLNESLHYSMDYELWIKIGLSHRVGNIHTLLSAFRKQPNQKTFTTNNLQYRENLKIRSRYGGVKQKYAFVRHLLAEKIKRIE
jgi:glycosyltransferase involved in cell wall biosynthesis